MTEVRFCEIVLVCKKKKEKKQNKQEKQNEKRLFENDAVILSKVIP